MIGRLLGFVPAWAWALFLAAIVTGLVAGVSQYEVRLASLRSDLASEQRLRAQEQSTYRQAALDQATAFHTKERGWEDAKKESQDEAERQAAEAAAGLARADAARSRVQQRADSLAAACYRPAPGAGAVAGSSNAAGAGLLLANVFGRADTRAGQLADYADKLRVAGEACNREHDSVSAR